MTLTVMILRAGLRLPGHRDRPDGPRITKRYGKPYGGLTDPLRAVEALLDAKAVVGGRSAPTISGGWHRDA